MPIPNDYIMACSLFSTSSKCTNLKRRLTLIEDIIHQRGDSSLMYRRLRIFENITGSTLKKYSYVITRSFVHLKYVEMW